MSEDRYTLHVYNSKGELWDRVHGAGVDLREQGVCFTTGKGQTTWKCTLLKNGTPMASCKRGVWSEVKP